MATERASVCPLDCPDTCSLSVTVENERIVRVRGSHANPYTKGVICAKVARSYPAFVHGPGRLRTPLRRVGRRGEDRFEPISWDAALDLIYERFSTVVETYGPQAIVPLNYAGPHGFLAGGSMDLRFFHRLGASLLDRGPLCGGIRIAAWLGTFGPVPGIRPEQVREAKLVIAWGNNVTVSNLHLAPLMKEAREGGATLAVVDPRRTKIAEQADLHLALQPGTDVVLAFAVAAELERRGGLDRDFIARHVQGAEEFLAQARPWTLERAAATCGVPTADIARLAALYQDASPAAISVGNGLERNRNGGSGIRAIFALPALAGKFGVRGGGLINGAGSAFPKTLAKLQRPDLVPPGTRTLNIIDMGQHLLDEQLSPPIKALFIYNHNPVIVHPEQNRLRRGLLREDLFIAGADVVMTDSMRYADVVLPACSHFEHDDLFPAYGQHWLQRAAPVIPHQGEALPNTEIFRRLAARFGFAEPCFRAGDAELMDDAVDGARLGGHRPSEISTEQALAMTIDGEEAVLFHNVWPKTRSGKVELASASFVERHGELLPSFQPLASHYPLALLSPASDKRITTTFGHLADSATAAPLDIHPADAGARGLKDGMRVRVWNDLGEVHLHVRVTDAVPRGVVATPRKGGWLATSDNGQTISALCPAHHADLAAGACFNDARVEVAAASAA
jgi:anaerobic selenocysteine-containing dehydrogenase